VLFLFFEEVNVFKSSVAYGTTPYMGQRFWTLGVQIRRIDITNYTRAFKRQLKTMIMSYSSKPNLIGVPEKRTIM